MSEDARKLAIKPPKKYYKNGKMYTAKMMADDLGVCYNAVTAKIRRAKSKGVQDIVGYVYSGYNKNSLRKTGKYGKFLTGSIEHYEAGSDKEAENLAINLQHYVKNNQLGKLSVRRLRNHLLVHLDKSEKAEKMLVHPGAKVRARITLYPDHLGDGPEVPKGVEGKAIQPVSEIEGLWEVAWDGYGYMDADVSEIEVVN